MSNKVNFKQTLEKIKLLHIQESPSGGSNSFEHLCTECCFMKQYWIQRHGLTGMIVVGIPCLTFMNKQFILTKYLKLRQRISDIEKGTSQTSIEFPLLFYGITFSALVELSRSNHILLHK